jgi:tetratricopeptide (TPR) repeat protein
VNNQTGKRGIIVNGFQWATLILPVMMIVGNNANALAAVKPTETCSPNERSSMQKSTEMADKYMNYPGAPVELRVMELSTTVPMFVLTGHPGCALEDANEAMQLAPDSAKAHIARAQAYQALGKLDLALADYNQAVSIAEHGGGKVDVYWNGSVNRSTLVSGAVMYRELFYEQQQQWALALADCDYLIRLAQIPMAVTQNKSRRAKVYLGLRRFDDAIADCNEVISYAEGNRTQSYEIYITRADAELGKGDLAHAVLDYDEGVRQLDDASKTYTGMAGLIPPGISANLAQSTWSASDYFNGELAKLLLKSCVAKTKGGWVKAAVVDCQRALKITPKDVGIHEALGLAYEKLGDTKGATDEFKQALTLDPNFTSRDQTSTPHVTRFLNTEVEHAVTLAEAAASDAQEKAAETRSHEVELRSAVSQAENAALQAKMGVPGYAVLTMRVIPSCIPNEICDEHYAGQVARLDNRDVPNGFGILERTNTDKYSGHWVNGKFDGPGVYGDHHYGETVATWRDGLRGDGLAIEGEGGRRVAAGEWRGNMFLGVIHIDVSYYPYAATTVVEEIGQHCQVAKQVCYKVETMRDGSRFAGRFVHNTQANTDERDGFGALFDNEGNIIQQGLWEKGKFKVGGQI